MISLRTPNPAPYGPRSLRTVTKRIEEAYMMRKPGDNLWYEQGSDWAIQTARYFDVPSVKVAGIAAVLSPKVTWKQTQRMTFQVLNRDTNITYLPRQLEKARHIRELEIGSLGDILTIIGQGQKTRSFFLNLWWPWSPKEVTIDRHMVDLCFMGVGKTYPAYDLVKLDRNGLYDWLAHGFRVVAKRFDVTPCKLQAGCWVVHKRAKKVGWTSN